uniref:Rrp9 n=1 Tax=Phaffia rhodozyma TaxID=264483 RepID=A0A1C9U692_PHARH|nr:Rrp9 [Phaffia rhodozyma]
MPDAFFSKPSSSKRKRPGKPNNSPSSATNGKTRPTPALTKKSKRDEELSEDDGSDVGVDDMDFRRDTRGGSSDEEEAERAKRETGNEKRLRLAREYLKNVEEEQDDGTFDAAEIDREIMAARLQADVLAHSPKIHVFISQSLSKRPRQFFLPLPNHPPTAARVSPSTPYIYTSTKAGAITKFSLQTGKLLAHFPRAKRAAKGKDAKGKGKASSSGAPGAPEGHSDEVLDLAISDDGKWMASAGKDGVVGCWDVDGETGRWVRGLKGHRDSVTSLAFRSPTLTLYTTSLDRTISIFSLSTLSHLETLFGHQDVPTALSTLRAESVISAGSRDRTVRFWKIPEESQLVFRGGGGSKGVWEEDDDIEEELERFKVLHGREGEKRAKLERRKRRGAKGKDAYREGRIDCVAMIDEQNFLSGGDSGAIALWTITKKKPVFIQHLAHGVNEHVSESEGIIGQARWITSLACLPYGDTFASGSWDGSVRIWSLASNLKSFSLLFTIPAKGFVNSLQLITPSSSILDFTNWRSQNKSASSSVSSLSPSEEDETTKTTATVSKGAQPESSILLVACVGQEPRLGRWMKLKREDGVRNGVVIAHLELRGQAEQEELDAEARMQDAEISV